MLTFKTLRCRNPYHFKQQQQTLQYRSEHNESGTLLVKITGCVRGWEIARIQPGPQAFSLYTILQEQPPLCVQESETDTPAPREIVKI